MLVEILDALRLIKPALVSRGWQMRKSQVSEEALIHVHFGSFVFPP